MIDEACPQRELTYGEKSVGLTFNPSANHDVNLIKEHFANIIDMLNDKRETANSDVNRMLSIAITEAQTAQMWAVKAVTWKF